MGKSGVLSYLQYELLWRGGVCPRGGGAARKPGSAGVGDD
jgi:hypothetical protein